MRQADLVRGLAAWWRRRRAQPEMWAGGGPWRRLVSLRPGQRGTIRDLAGDRDLQARLAALGVTPGAAVTVLQTFPALVIQCDETELALEPRVARSVLVEVARVEDAPAVASAAARDGMPARPDTEAAEG